MIAAVTVPDAPESGFHVSTPTRVQIRLTELPPVCTDKPLSASRDAEGKRRLFNVLDLAGRLRRVRAGCPAPPSAYRRPKPWMRKPSHDAPSWISHVTALDAAIDGRARAGWMPSSASAAKRYEPIEIDWRTLPSAVRIAFERVADAIVAGRVIGSDHYADKHGTTVEERLGALNRLYKAWTRGRAAEGALVREAASVARMIESAPKPRRQAPRKAKRVLSAAERQRAAVLIAEYVSARVGDRDEDIQAEVENRAHEELTDPSTRCDDARSLGLDVEVRRACERAKKHVWARLSREHLRPDPEPKIKLGNKTSTRISDGDMPKPPAKMRMPKVLGGPIVIHSPSILDFGP